MRSLLTWTQCLLSWSIAIDHVASSALPQDKSPLIVRADAPPSPLLFNDTVQSLQDSARQAADAEKAFVDNLVKTLTTSTVSFDNSIKLYWQHQNELEQQTAKYAFYSTTAAYPDLVDAANDASATYNNATTNTFTNDQFYALVEVVYHQYNPQAKRSDGATGVKSPDTLSTEAKIILQYTMDSFNDNGFALQPQQRDRLSEVQSQIDGLNSDYTNALGNVTGPTIFFTREELDGVSDDRLASLEKDNGRQDGKYGLAPYSDSDVVEVAKNETTRQTIILATQRLVPENIDRLVQIVSLRAEQASLLGEKSYSAYVLKDTLIKSPENVQTLLDQIADKLEPLNDKQYIQPLKDAKEKDTGNSTFLFDWDLSFYKNLLNTAKSTKRDDAAQADPSEWYEAVATTQAILKLFGSVFHFTFTKLDPATVVPGVPSEQIVWDPSMELYAVYDSDSNQYLGTLYLDNFHRSSDDAISSSAYSGSIGSIYVRPDGSVSPAAVYIKNYFDQPTGDTPTLLDSDSIHLLFRQMTQIVETFSSRTTYATLSFTDSAPIDYSSIIESSLEAYANNPAVLEQLSSHWSYGSQSAKDAWQKAHPNQAQPPQKIVQNNSGDNKPSALENGHNVAFALFQIWLSVWDQALFTQTHPVDTKSLDLNFIYNTLEKKYRHLNKIDDLGVKDTSLWDFSYTQDTHPAQDPGYYFAYIISFLYAADIFSMFEQNPFDSAVGGRFRETLLSHGAATDDFEGQIDAFLGRQVDKSKYYATLGA